MPDEKPLKFPDLPADHPANQESPSAQTEVPVSSGASTETPPSTASSPTLGGEPEQTQPESSPIGASTDSASEAPTDSTSIPADSSPPSIEPSLTSTIAVPSGVAHDGSVYRARSDDDVLTNSFCKVIAGPYAGRYGVFWSTASLGADGWPSEVVVRTRDAEDENIVVSYADIRPDIAGRR